MKIKILCFCFITGFTVIAQVKLGTKTGTVATNANFQVEGTTVTDQFVILKNANVGVGTNAPTSKLHVVLGSGNGNLTAWDNTAATFGQNGATGSAIGLGFDTTTNAAWISTITPATAWRPLNFLGNNWRFLANGTTEVFSILNNGNIGIGVSAPAAQLHTSGSIRFAGAGIPAVGKVLTSDASGNATWTAPATSGTVTSVSGILPITVATGTSTPAISIATANTTTTGAITGTDWTTFNNKIGSASNGLTTTSGDVKLGGTLTQATSITLSTTIDNLGVIRDVAGTSGESTNGYANLTIGGSGSSSNSFNTGGKIKLTGYAGSEAGTITGYEGSGQRIMSLKGGAATGTNGMYLLNSGNIGIGVEVPAAQLHTTGSIRFAGAGTPAVGKVLTSDASGNATWNAPAPSGTVTSVSGILPITVATGTSTPAISIATANTTTTGAITGTDWTTFNNKIGSASNGLTTTSGDVKLGGTLTQATTIGLTSTIDNLKIVRDVAGTTGESTNGYATLSIGGSGTLSNSSFTGGRIKLTGYGGADNGSIAAYEGSGQRIMSLKGGAATGTNGMYLLNSGNIGIGVEVPAAQLHTTGSIRFAGAGTPAVGKVLTSDASGNATWNDPATSGTVTSVTGTLPITVATGTSTPAISIATANTTTTGAITGTDWTTFNNKIGSASNGLTTTSGDVKLGGTLTQATSITLSTTIDNLGIIRDVAGTSGESTNGYANLTIGGSGSSSNSFNTGGKIKLTGFAGTEAGTITGYEGSGQRIMSLKGGAATGTNGMYLLNSGNIGIGVEVPAAQLHTTGSIRFAGAGTPAVGKVLTSDASGNATWNAPATSGTVTSVTGTLPISVATGTSTPAISIATANTTTTGAITGTDWTKFNNKIGSASNGLLNTFGNVTLGGNLAFSTILESNGFNFSLNGAGNLGIGTNSPNAKLHVILGQNTGNLNAWDGNSVAFGQSGSTGSALGVGYDTTNDSAWISSLAPSTAWKPLKFLGNNWRFLANGATEVFSILNNGNIGIGVSAPAAQLHTSGSIRFAGAGTPGANKVLTSDATGNATWEDKTTLYTGDGTLTSNRIIRMSATVDNLKIIRDVPGAAGETTTGYATLSIGGAGINGGDSSFTGGKIKLTGYQGNDFGSIAAYEASSQRIMSIKGGAATGTNGMYFLSSGNIGIGVEVPTAQLHTTGSVKFAGAGTPGANKVLTSDGSGNATWENNTTIYNGNGTLTSNRTINMSSAVDNLRIIRDVAGTAGESNNGYANLTIGGSGTSTNSFNTGGRIKLTGYGGTEAGTLTGYENAGQRILSLKGGAATGTNGMYLLNSGNIGVGVEVPSAQFHTTGSLRFSGAGTPAVSKVLTSDASGNATWQDTGSLVLTSEAVNLNATLDLTTQGPGGTLKDLYFIDKSASVFLPNNTSLWLGRQLNFYVYGGSGGSVSYQNKLPVNQMLDASSSGSIPSGWAITNSGNTLTVSGLANRYTVITFFCDGNNWWPDMKN